MYLPLSLFNIASISIYIETFIVLRYNYLNMQMSEMKLLMNEIYFDNAATTRVDEDIAAAAPFQS